MFRRYKPEGPVAQRIEHSQHRGEVSGSNPAGNTKTIIMEKVRVIVIEKGNTKAKAFFEMIEKRKKELKEKIMNLESVKALIKKCSDSTVV